MFPNKQLPNKQLLLYLKSSAEIIFPRKFMQSFKTKNILAGWDAELCQLCCLLARSWCNSGWWCHTLDLFQLLEQLTPAAVCWIQRPVFWVINEVAASIFLFFFFCFVLLCLFLPTSGLFPPQYTLMQTDAAVLDSGESVLCLTFCCESITTLVCCMQSLRPCFYKNSAHLTLASSQFDI